MKAYQELSKEELLSLKNQLEKEFEDAKGKGLKLDMSRGKPGADQLDLSMGMLDVLDSKTALKSENGTDLRNYGVLDGIPEAKKLIADVIGTKPENVIIYGNSSLNIIQVHSFLSHTNSKQTVFLSVVKRIYRLLII